MSLKSRLKKLEETLEMAPGSVAHPRTGRRRDCCNFVSLACYDSDNRLHSVALEDGTCLEGEEAARAMKSLADPQHTRVVSGIDLDLVLGRKEGISCESPSQMRQ
jgi:hypothetical protein